jgi:hypothetical protein
VRVILFRPCGPEKLLRARLLQALYGKRSQRKLVEQSFAWIKHWAGFRQVKLRSRRRVEWLFRIAVAAYNLVRMTRLQAAPA